MLLSILLASTFVSAVYSQTSVKDTKPYVFPIPFELPNRNDRSEQCWIRIEDVDLTETLAVFCHIAHAFLRSYIHDYNSRKMIEDDVIVSLWNEEPRNPNDRLPKIPNTDPQTVKDWKTTTVFDPIMHMRLYVSQKADCRLVMYSREGMSNYNVECGPFLYFVNERLNGSAVLLHVQNYVIAACMLLVFLRNRFLIS